MLKIIPNKNNIGAEIIFNTKNLSKKNLLVIKKALNEYGMLYFRKQKLNSKFYIKFAKNFGKIAKYPRLKGLSKKYPEITVVQRKITDKGPSFGEQFHTDSIYTKKPPKFTMYFQSWFQRKVKQILNFHHSILLIKIYLK